jgi:hypothetical protein
MNKDMYFASYIKDMRGTIKGIAVRIPPETGKLPGDRIRALTDAARLLPLQGNERLRTEMLVVPPSNVETRDLSDYLWADGSINANRLVRHLTVYKQGQSPHLFQPRVGTTVVMEEEFLGREKPLAELESSVSANRSCHLRAPRRYGKSSLMGRLSVKLPDAVLMELSDIGTLAGFLKALLSRSIRNDKAIKCLYELREYRAWPVTSDAAIFSQVFNKAFSDLIAKNQNKLFPLLRETMTALADGDIILLIDEFSLFLREMLDNSEDELRTFLEIYRKLRTRPVHPLISVFAGSAGLSTFIELLGMHELFDDLIAVDVPPISSSEAKLLAEELFYGMEKTPSLPAVEKVVELTGNDETVPYFVHALTHYTVEQAALRREISEIDVELAYYDRLLGVPGNCCFRDFILRERGYPENYRSSASHILKELSLSAPEIISDEELRRYCEVGCDFAKLMTCLQEDYDLVFQNGGWRMRSRVIADRWRLGEPWLTIGGR